MDYQKINSRMVYGLVLSVFAHNIVTYIIIAVLNTAFGIAQGFMPLFGLIGLVVNVYLGAVSFIVAHRTILQGEVISPGEAFQITSQSKTYFWQYLIVTGIPVVLAIIGGVILVTRETLPYDLYTMLMILAAGLMGLYYILMAFFGTSLVATAVGGDGMMMVSRGRETFFYSLTRLILLPTLALAGVIALVYFSLFQGDRLDTARIAAMLGDNANDAIINIMLMSVVLQLIVILFNLITAVVITKAFLLAEVRLALKGQPTEWGKRAFGIAEQTRGLVYK